MKYTKKLYYGNFTPGRLVRPKNHVLRSMTDALLFPWYVILLLGICSFLPAALFADSFRFLKLIYHKAGY